MNMRKEKWPIRVLLREEDAHRRFLLNTHRPFLQMDLCVCQEEREHKRTHTKTNKWRKQLRSCSESLWSIQLPRTYMMRTVSFPEIGNSHVFVVPARPSQTRPPTQTSCCCCPLTSLQLCSGPETRRLAAWCQTEWVFQELSGPPLPETSLSGTLRWLCVFLLALLCEREMNYKRTWHEATSAHQQPEHWDKSLTSTVWIVTVAIS